MIKTHSSFIVSYIKDIEKTYSFYKLIGAQIIELTEDKLVIKIGDYEIHFVKDISEPWEEYKYIAKLNNPGNGIIYYIEVDNIEESLDLVKKAGGKIVSEIKDNWWDGKEFLFEDPNQYKIVFYQMK